jgi:hypothetical protein
MSYDQCEHNGCEERATHVLRLMGQTYALCPNHMKVGRKEARKFDVKVNELKLTLEDAILGWEGGKK